MVKFGWLNSQRVFSKLVLGSGSWNGCGAQHMASELSAYVISDRASWLNFGRKGDLDDII